MKNKKGWGCIPYALVIILFFVLAYISQKK